MNIRRRGLSRFVIGNLQFAICNLRADCGSYGFQLQIRNYKLQMASLVSHPDEVRVISKRFGQGATDIDRYLQLDGYKAVQKALAMQPDAIINEVKNSGLRGRGGAG